MLATFFGELSVKVIKFTAIVLSKRTGIIFSFFGAIGVDSERPPSKFVFESHPVRPFESFLFYSSIHSLRVQYLEKRNIPELLRHGKQI